MVVLHAAIDRNCACRGRRWWIPSGAPICVQMVYACQSLLSITHGEGTLYDEPRFGQWILISKLKSPQKSVAILWHSIRMTWNMNFLILRMSETFACDLFLKNIEQSWGTHTWQTKFLMTRMWRGEIRKYWPIRYWPATTISHFTDYRGLFIKFCS